MSEWTEECASTLELTTILKSAWLKASSQIKILICSIHSVQIYTVTP